MWCCRKLQCRSQIWLGCCGCGVGCSCSSDAVPSLGIPYATGVARKRKKKCRNKQDSHVAFGGYIILIPLIMILFFLAFPMACWISWDQGSNPSRSSDKTRFLTCCATRLIMFRRYQGNCLMKCPHSEYDGDVICGIIWLDALSLSCKLEIKTKASVRCSVNIFIKKDLTWLKCFPSSNYTTLGLIAPRSCCSCVKGSSSSSLCVWVSEQW